MIVEHLNHEEANRRQDLVSRLRGGALVREPREMLLDVLAIDLISRSLNLTEETLRHTQVCCDGVGAKV